MPLLPKNRATGVRCQRRLSGIHARTSSHSGKTGSFERDGNTLTANPSALPNKDRILFQRPLVRPTDSGDNPSIRLRRAATSTSIDAGSPPSRRPTVRTADLTSILTRSCQTVASISFKRVSKVARDVKDVDIAGLVMTEVDNNIKTLLLQL